MLKSPLELGAVPGPTTWATGSQTTLEPTLVEVVQFPNSFEQLLGQGMGVEVRVTVGVVVGEKVIVAVEVGVPVGESVGVEVWPMRGNAKPQERKNNRTVFTRGCRFVSDIEAFFI